MQVIEGVLSEMFMSNRMELLGRRYVTEICRGLFKATLCDIHMEGQKILIGLASVRSDSKGLRRGDEVHSNTVENRGC